MNKKQGILIGIALVLLFTGIALATSTNLSASSDIEIYAFDQNPAGRDEGNEWVTLYNPSNESVDIGNRTLETADGERETIPEGTTLYPFAYYVYTPPYQWRDNNDEVRANLIQYNCHSITIIGRSNTPMQLLRRTPK